MKKQKEKKTELKKFVTKKPLQRSCVVVEIDSRDFDSDTLNELAELARESQYGAVGDNTIFLDINCDNINMKRNKNQKIVELYNKTKSFGFAWITQ